MAAISSRAWKIVMAIAAVFFIAGMLFTGFIIPGLFFLVLLVVGGAIALLNRGSNTPGS
jgi:predicted membrane protein